MRLYTVMYRDLVMGALAEDLGRAGDVTSAAIVPAPTRARGLIVAREPGIAAGVDVAKLAVSALDADAEFLGGASDGDPLEAGTLVLEVRADAQAILAAERVALNFLGRLSGIATKTHRAVSALRRERLSTRIVCTRKTTPLLRTLEKYAVSLAGGSNHRFGLDDGVLIKDNHLVLAPSIRAAVESVRARVGHMVKIEIEVDELDQLREALELGVDAVLVDNMSPERLREAVAIVAGRAVVEASGGITEDSLLEVARTGVDLISMGSLTHSAPALDLSLELEPVDPRPTA